METEFKAFVVRETSPDVFDRRIETRTIDDLPDGDVLIRVDFSSLNYKDALAASGRRGIMRYPGTPGVEAVGVVVGSKDRKFVPGDQVIAGIDLRKSNAGGFARFIRVPSAWVIKLPGGMSVHDAAIYGVAGFTAGLCVETLEQNGLKPDGGEVLVTGATGGVGGFAVSILAQAGYDVVAVSGKGGKIDYLHFLGASRVIERAEFEKNPDRPLLAERWSGVVDTVGGNILSTAVRGLRYGCTAVSCGNVASNELCTSILPFILRAVKLIGIDAVQITARHRNRIWNKLAREWRLDTIDAMAEEITLKKLSARIDSMLAGEHTGRTIINLGAR